MQERSNIIEQQHQLLPPNLEETSPFNKPKNSRSKILLYQKPLVPQGYEQSSAVSSVSNTAYGTLYQEQMNRLQAQYNSKLNENKNMNDQRRSLEKQNGRFTGVTNTSNNHTFMKRPTTEEPFRKSYQILKKPTTASNIVNRQSQMNDARRISQRPKTMGSRKPDNTINTGQIPFDRTTMATTQDGFHSQQPHDLRKVMKLKKQQLQQGFYDTLKKGQTQANDQMNRGNSQILSDIDKSPGAGMSLGGQLFNPADTRQLIDSTMFPDNGNLNFKSYQNRLSSGLSLKANNLKYHLMRQLLQKKDLEEIVLIKERLQLENAKNIDHKKIQLPSGIKKQHSVDKDQNTNQADSDNSDQSSEVEDDVEPFDPTAGIQDKTSAIPQITNASHQNQTVGGIALTTGNTNQTPFGLPNQQLDTSYLKDIHMNAAQAIALERKQTMNGRRIKTSQNQQRQTKDQYQDLTLIQAQSNNSYQITKYNYYGIPLTSMVDNKNSQVQQRKKRMDIVSNIALNKGCQKFNIRTKKADQIMSLRWEVASEIMGREEDDYYGHADKSQQNDSMMNFNRHAYRTFSNSENRGVNSTFNHELSNAFSVLDMKREQRQNVEFSHMLSSNLEVNILENQNKRTKEMENKKLTMKVLEDVQKLKVANLPTGIDKLSKKMTNMELYNTKDWRPQLANPFHQALKDETKNRQEEYARLNQLDPVYRPPSSYKYQYSKSFSYVRKSQGIDLKNLLLNKRTSIKENINGQNNVKDDEELESIQNEMEKTADIANASIDVKSMYNFTNWGNINSTLQHILNTHKFGDFYSVSKIEDALLRDYTYTIYPQLQDQQQNVQLKVGKIYSDEDRSTTLVTASQSAFSQIQPTQFNILFFGKRCPLSKCCKLSLCLNICGRSGTAKLMCMEKLCQFNPQQQLIVPLEIMIKLFPHKYSTNDIQMKPRKKSALQQKQELNNVNMELKKNVIAGSYKFKSLRQVVSRGGRTKTGRKSTGKNRMNASDNDTDSIYDYGQSDDNNEDVEYIDVNQQVDSDDAIDNINEQQDQIIDMHIQ